VIHYASVANIMLDIDQQVVLWLGD